MSEPDMTPVFASVASLVDGEGTGEPCAVPVVGVDENGEVEIRHVPHDEHECPEFVDMQIGMNAIHVADDQACPCRMYGAPCNAYEVDVDPVALSIVEVREVELPDQHRVGVTTQMLDYGDAHARRVRVTCRPGFDPIGIVQGAIGLVRDESESEGPCDSAECTCEFSDAEYPIMVRCADPLCPLPPIELPTYEDSVAWARIHRLTGCTMTAVEIESGSGEISR